MPIIKHPQLCDKGILFHNYKTLVDTVNHLQQTDGNKLRSERNRYRFAKITDVVSDSDSDTYKAEEVAYIESTGLWTTVSGGYTWDDDSSYGLNNLVPLNATDTFTIGQVVEVAIDPNNRVYWTICSTAGGGSSIVEVKLTSRSDTTTYAGDIYGNGSDSAYTEHNQTIRVRGFASDVSLPTNVVFYATKIPWLTIGNPSTRTQYYTIINVPRWM